MTAVSVVFDGTRLDPADSTDNWGGASTETDYYYQNGTCVAQQIKTSRNGMDLDVNAANGSADLDMSTRVWLIKQVQTNYGEIDGNGIEFETHSTDGTDYRSWYLFVAPGTGDIIASQRLHGQRDYPRSGGWLVTAIDPNLTYWQRQTVGTFVPSSVDNIHFFSDAASSAKAPNHGVDAVDYMTLGDGLTLTGGSGADADGMFQDFSDADYFTDPGGSSGGWGVVVERDGVMFVSGVLTIGSATETDFTDSNRVLVFPDHLVPTGFCGIDFSLANASSVIDISNCVFSGRGRLYGVSTGTNLDTRPDYEVSSTSGALTIDGCTFDNFRLITLTSPVVMTNCSFIGGGEEIIVADADISGGTFARWNGVSSPHLTIEEEAFDSYWRLNETSGATATDEMGSQNGTYVNTPTYSRESGKADGSDAIGFQGSADEHITAGTGFSPGTGDFSFGFRLAFPQSSMPSSGSTGIIGRSDGTGKWGFAILSGGAGINKTARLHIDGSDFDFATNSLDPYIGYASGAQVVRYFHTYIVSVDRSGNATLYIDGVEDSTVSVSAKSAANLNDSGTFYIAGRSATDTLGGTGTGLTDMSDVWYESGLVTAAQAKRIHLSMQGLGDDASCLYWNVATDPDGELDDLTFTMGDGYHHALELGPNTPSTITLRNWTVSGFSTANGDIHSVIYNNSAKAITINTPGVAGTISYKNGASASTTVQNTVTLTVNVEDKNGDPIQNVRVAIYRTSDDTELMNELSTAGGVATEQYSGATPAAVYIRLRKGTSSPNYIPIDASGTIDANGFTATYVMQDDTINAN